MPPKKKTLPTTKENTLPTTKKKTLPTTKPRKSIRDRKDVQNLKVENTRKAHAKKKAVKQEQYRSRNPTNSNKRTNSVPAEIRKQRNKISRERNRARINHSISVTQKTSDYGDYLWIDSIPICDMSQLLNNFKTTQFRNTYDNNSTPVSACNLSLEKEEQSTYWMLNESKNKDIKKSGHWKDHPHTSTTNDIVLSNFMTRVGSGLNNALKKI